MSRRSYRQNCALAHAADIIGERWTLLILRDLLIGPRRYGELASSLAGMGSNLLAARLKQLEADGIVERADGPEGQRLYRLSDLGRALEPAVLALVRWGFSMSARNRADYSHQDRWDVLALRAAFRPDRAPADPVTVGFTGGNPPVWVTVDGGSLYWDFEDQPADVLVDGSLADLNSARGQGEEGLRRMLIEGSVDTLAGFARAFDTGGGP